MCTLRWIKIRRKIYRCPAGAGAFITLETIMSTVLASLRNGVDLAYDVIGAISRPVVMPILGITDNMTDWPDHLCAPFVEAGYCVVRHECRAAIIRMVSATGAACSRTRRNYTTQGIREMEPGPPSTSSRP